MTLAADRPGTMTDSRAHLALAPFLDLLNHSDTAEVETRVDRATLAFEIVANAPVASGSEALIFYGPHDNGFLLVEYGFVLPNNRFSSVLVGEALLAALGGKGQDRLAVLSDAGIAVSEIRCGADELDWSLLIVLRILALDRATWQTNEALWRKLLHGEIDSFDEATERRARRFLRDIAEAQAAIFSSALSTDILHDTRAAAVQVVRDQHAHVWSAIAGHCNIDN